MTYMKRVGLGVLRTVEFKPISANGGGGLVTPQREARESVC